MKKFLSMVLPLTMALSLVTVSAGATSFEDDGDITYQEAVTVIAGLGIVEGYEDGSFNPTGGLTRGAAAKIICNLILGPTTASALNATSAPFSDVPTSNEFAGYIAYCSQNGIISGYADGTFRPSAALTGYAFMKMLLGALGYDSTYEGYTGTNWSIQVAKQALGIDLDDGNDNFNGTDNVTREEACLYAFNTLKATMVEYSSSNTVIVGDVQVTTSSERSEVENNDPDTDGNIEDDGLLQFAEEYFEDLTADPDTDDFGRPATTWDYDGDELGTYAEIADGSMVIVNNYDMETWLTDGNYLNYSDDEIMDTATVYFNGTDEGDYEDVYEDVYDEVIASDGDVLEVFENDDGDVDTIVFRSYTYAVVNEVIDDLSSTHETRGATVGIDLEDIDGNSFGTYYDDYNDSDKILGGYNAGYTEGTVLAIALNEDNAILDSYEMESVTGTPEAAEEVETYDYGYGDVLTDGSITIDGTEYPYAGQLTGLEDGENVDFDEEYTIYLTAEGYVLAVDGDSTAALDDVYYVAGAYGERSSGRMTYYIEAVSVSDGLSYTLELSDDGETDFGVSGTGYDTSVAGLYVLDEEDDKYFIDSDYSGALEDGEEVGSYTVVVASGLSQNVDSDSTTIRFTGSDVSRLYLTDTTFFVSVEGDAANESLDISTATGVMTVDAEDSVDLSAYAFYKTDDSDAVFVVYVADTLAGSVSLSDVVYLTDDASNATTDGYRVDLFALDSMELLEGVTIDSRDDQGFYTYDLDDDGIYELSVTSGYNLENQNLTDDEVDDEDGYAEGVTFTEVRSSRATGSTYEDGETDQGGVDFVAVTFADAVVIDTRSSSQKSDALYSSDIESASALSTAINRGWVQADVFVEDGEIIFVAVVDAEDESGSSSGGGTTTGGDDVDTSLSGSSAEATYTLGSNGRLTFEIAYSVPDYVAEGATPDTFSIDIYADGDYVDTLDEQTKDPALSFTGVDEDGVLTVSYRSGTGDYTDYVDMDITFEIEDEEFSDLKVEYVDEEGDPIESQLADGYTASVDMTATGPEIEFTIDSLSTTPASMDYEVSQGSTVLASGTQNVSGDWSKTTFSITLDEDDLDYEVITVEVTGASSTEEVYSVTNSANGTTLSGSDALQIQFRDSAGTVASGTTVAAGTTLTVRAQVQGRSITESGVYGYLVTIDGVGEALTTGTWATVGEITVDSNVTIDSSDITVEVIDELEASVAWGTTFVRLTFNRPIDTASLPTFGIDGVSSAVLETSTSTDSDGNTVLTINVVENATLSSGSIITVSGDFADADYSGNAITGSNITLGTTTSLS